MSARAIGALFLLLTSSGCGCGQLPPNQGQLLGDGFAGVRAVDSTTVELTFSRDIDQGSVNPGAFDVANFTVVPPLVADVDSAAAADSRTVNIGTSELVAGARYTLT